MAWKYIDELLRAGSEISGRVHAMKIGASERFELDSGVAAIEQSYAPKLRADGFFESHRRFIDIQVVVAGVEAMEVVDLDRAVVRQPYQPERDLVIYQDISEASRLVVGAGFAAVFEPSDVHMPSLRTDSSPACVLKSVLKIPVGR